MMRTGSGKVGWLTRTILSGVVVLLGSGPTWAQLGGAAGGGAAGGGGAGRTGGGTGGGMSTGGGLGGGNTGGATSPISGAGGTGAGGTSTGTAGPTSQDPFTGFYSSPLSPGLGTYRKIAAGNFSQSSGTGASSGQGFSTNFTSATGQIETMRPNMMNQPLYAVTTSTTAGGRGTVGGGLGGLTGAAGTTQAGGTNFTTVGMRRTLPYITVPVIDPTPPPAPAAVQTDLSQTLANATTLKSRGNIQVVVNGSTVVLQGVVPNERERRVAEATVRMRPGVRDVRNELQVANGNGPTP